MDNSEISCESYSRVLSIIMGNDHSPEPSETDGPEESGSPLRFRFRKFESVAEGENTNDYESFSSTYQDTDSLEESGSTLRCRFRNFESVAEEEGNTNVCESLFSSPYDTDTLEELGSTLRCRFRNFQSVAEEEGNTNVYESLLSSTYNTELGSTFCCRVRKFESVAEKEENTNDYESSFLSTYQDADVMPESGAVLGIFRRFSLRPFLEGLNLSKLKTAVELVGCLLLFVLLMASICVVAFGAMHIGTCPANWLLPYLAIWVGITAAALPVHILVHEYRERYVPAGGRMDALTIHYCSFAIVLLIEMASFHNMTVSYDGFLDIDCYPFYLGVAGFNSAAVVTSLFVGSGISIFIALDNELEILAMFVG